MNEIKPQIEEVKSYKCNWCGELYTNEYSAAKCAFNHAKIKLANIMLMDGDSLESIERVCNFGWNLSDVQKRITKDNCFIVSYWQCCDKPAYRIMRIDYNGYLLLHGKGGFSSYGSIVSLRNLPQPHPKEELFIY